MSLARTVTRSPIRIGCDELDAADRDGHAVAPAPADRAGVAGLVDPFHDHAAMHLAAEIDVGRLGEEAEGHLALLARHGAARPWGADYAANGRPAILERPTCDSDRVARQHVRVGSNARDPACAQGQSPCVRHSGCRQPSRSRRSAPPMKSRVQNDSLANGDSGTIQAGFVASEKAAAWLTSPCDGNIVAAQVFWRSLFGTAPDSIEDSIDIYRSGTFPVPGDLAQEIVGPVLTDGVLNEYRYLDENNTIPLIVPVVQDETFVVALTFAEAPDPTQGPSVVNDEDGIEPNRNAIYASLGGSSISGSRTRRSASTATGSSARSSIARQSRAKPTSASRCRPTRRNTRPARR